MSGQPVQYEQGSGYEETDPTELIFPTLIPLHPLFFSCSFSHPQSTVIWKFVTETSPKKQFLHLKWDSMKGIPAILHLLLRRQAILLAVYPHRGYYSCIGQKLPWSSGTVVPVLVFNWNYSLKNDSKAQEWWCWWSSCIVIIIRFDY